MAARSPFTVRLMLPPGEVRVVLGGELDACAAAELAHALAVLTGPGRGGRLVLGLAGVSFLDCACARVLAQAAGAWPGPVTVSDARPAVRRVLDLTGPAALLPAPGPRR